MKPLKLYMRNFKSYGEETPIFDFEAFDVVLLTGENGNGKSSIADAIAWCIWGQCKGMTGRGGIDDLVRTGADEMEVSLIFEEDGNRYKVIRKRDKRREQSSLDLFIEDSGEFIPISGNRIDETQSKIQNLIKLDYDTYLCTAYLSQGKADMFATKKPNERKEVLAEILNLSNYDRLAELAREERNRLQSEAEIVQRELYGLETRIEDEAAVKDTKKKVDSELEDMQIKEKETGEELDGYYEVYREKSGLVKSLEGSRENLIRTQEEIVDLKKEENELKTRIKSYKTLLEREEEIVVGYKRAKALSLKENTYREQLQIKTDLTRKLEAVESKIEREKQEIKYNIKLLEQKIEVEKVKLEKEDKLKKEEKVLIDALAKLLTLEEKVSETEEELNENITRIADLKAREKTLMEKLEDLRERYKDISGAKSNCPTCNTPLSEETKAKILKDMTQEGQRLQSELKDVQDLISHLNDRRKVLSKEIASFKDKLKDKSKMESHLAIIQRELEEAKRAKENMDMLISKRFPLEKSLKEKTYADELFNEQRDLKNEIDKLNYDGDAHRQIREELKKYEDIDKYYQDVQLAKARLSADEESMERVLKLIQDKEKYIQELMELIRQLEAATGDIESIKKKIYVLEMDRKKLLDDIRKLQSKKGALDERLKQIETAKEEMKEKKESIADLNREIELYKTLIEIYGKRGIQAAIIENAIPELQDETNRILAKITDGRLTVEFLTQRDTKSGSTVETLDIKISDGLDTRKYETYSGGEEFRINFAIRIALSKTLARRAGATVRMLVLDEGFGTLDEKGRERLAQVINAISDEFEKIIVITHIQDLKDYFSNQIEVYMTPNGSMFKPL
ncbi:MAG TPA: SMC family ATPase [Clostridiales bacterium]|nr:SMC family ATPase [Clostridiales bacterium]